VAPLAADGKTAAPPLEPGTTAVEATVTMAYALG
jgi:hypothetical protein